MTYRVEVTATAKADAQAAYLWLEERTPIHAISWFNGLVEAVEGLAEFPTRWPLAPENSNFDVEIRQLLYGKSPHVYRVLFMIRNNVVFVLHIRHGTRKVMKKSEIILWK